ncbi:MAG: FAD-dependent oxidoreductase [Pseudomonadota bacterium]
MADNHRYAVLFEPVTIGPKTAKNRFYQVPHCCGLGHLRPRAHAAMRGIKAEGGWAVVSTEEAEIHPTSDISPSIEQRIWDEHDLPGLRLMTKAVHAHGALAAIELVHNGVHAGNLTTRAPVLGPVGMAIDGFDPVSARAMDRTDIRNVRHWHRRAALNAADAGFDIVYVYAGHNYTLTQHFLSARHNHRTDEYGGSLENRLRLTRELLEDTKDAIGDRCAVAFRFAVDELLGAEGLRWQEEGREVVERLADLPDLWDVNVSDWENDSVTARFEPNEGYQEPFTAFVKSLTTKPVVGVGRFTSPDAMVSQINRGILDLIGAARPSISDPFLPEKIQRAAFEEIRECIGCNVCVASDHRSVPIRCTQNPTIGEEWRRNWHPERIAATKTDESVLVIGGGPAGLECTVQLGRRGYRVALAEKTTDLGGRARREAQLPGLSSYLRVVDYRVSALQELTKVEVFYNSDLTAEHALEFGFDHVLVATGAVWRRDGAGRHSRAGLDLATDVPLYTPDDILAGVRPKGRVLIYDDDHGHLPSAVAEALAVAGAEVVLATPADQVSSWTTNTMEHGRIMRRLAENSVRWCSAVTPHFSKTGVMLTCRHSGRENWIDCDAVVLATDHEPNDDLVHELRTDPERLQHAGIRSVRAIGDAASPGLIAHAIYSGHEAARALGRSTDEVEAEFFRREVISLDQRAFHA